MERLNSHVADSGRTSLDESNIQRQKFTQGESVHVSENKIRQVVY